MKRISPTGDLAFKKVLASNENKDVLQGFIHDFFEIMPTRIVIENPYSINDYKEIIQNEEVSILRQTLRDVTAIIEQGNFTAEIQIRRSAFFDERSLYYPFDRYCQNYNKQGELRKGLDGRVNRYSSLTPVYALNILGYTHFYDEEALRIFEFYDPKRHKKMNKDLIKIGFFELTKEKIETPNQRHWHEYFVSGAASAEAPEYIKKAAKAIEFVNLGKEEQRMALALEKARALYEEGLVDSYYEGMEKGIEKGMEKGKLEIALNMLNSGLSLEFVANCTGLSLEEIQKLLQES